MLIKTLKIKGALVLILFIFIPFLNPQAACAACSSPVLTPTTVDSGNYAVNAIRFGDIDSDGDKDIVTGSSAGAGDMYYYLNNGSGTYGAGVGLSSTQSSQYDIELGDVDVDGDIDIVSSDRYGETVKWYENNGGLSFTERSIASGLDADNVFDVAVGDLDGDTDLDVIVAISGTTDDIAWYRNNGNDTFTTMTAVDSNFPGANVLDAGDIDADGDIDIIGTSAESGGGASYYVNNGSGSFTETSLTTSPRQNGRIVDLDSDGDKDLLIIAQNAITWYARAGASYGGAQTIASGSYLFIGLDTKDMDGDGDMDFVTSEYSNSGGSWWKNNGSQSFTEQIITSTGYLYDVDAEDVSGDGNADVVFAAQNPDNDVILYTQSCDTTAPTVSTLSPLDGATNITTTTNLVVTFSENVTVQTGNITIKRSSDNTTFETIAINSGLVTGTGTSIITINPSGTLAEQTEYYVQIDATAIDDIAGNSYVGISDATTWNFTVGDFTAPLVNTFSPLDGATGVSRTSALSITFNEIVIAGSGNITLVYESNGSTVESISVASGQITGWGSTTLSITHTSPLSKSTKYAVHVAPTAIADTSGNAYLGIADETTWNFTAQGGGSTVVAQPKDFTISNVTATLQSNTAYITWDSGSDVQFVTIIATDENGENLVTTHYEKNVNAYKWAIPEWQTSKKITFTVSSTDLAQILSSADSNIIEVVVEVVTQEDAADQLPDLEPAELVRTVATGSYIKSPSFSTVYYVTEQYTRRPFPNGTIFFTYENSFDIVIEVSDEELKTLPLATPMLPKPGTVLVKMADDPKTYELDENSRLRLLDSEAVAVNRYGENWAAYIIDIEPTLFIHFLSEGAALPPSETLPNKDNLKTRDWLTERILYSF